MRGFGFQGFVVEDLFCLRLDAVHALALLRASQGNRGVALHELKAFGVGAETAILV